MLWFNKQGAILSLTILQTGHFLLFFCLPYELVNKNAKPHLGEKHIN